MSEFVEIVNTPTELNDEELSLFKTIVANHFSKFQLTNEAGQKIADDLWYDLIGRYYRAKEFNEDSVFHVLTMIWTNAEYIRLISDTINQIAELDDDYINLYPVLYDRVKLIEFADFERKLA